MGERWNHDSGGRLFRLTEQGIRLSLLVSWVLL
nr:MAG TPA: hypothetical protein [Caudoviricetes sp.]